MKRTVTILVTVAALVVAVVFADRATRKQVSATAKAGAPGDGTMAPEFTAKNLQDQNVKLSQYRGKVVFINFWATWCDPCRIEIPWLIELQEKYGDKGFTVVGIAMDEEGKQIVSPFVEKERFTVNGQPRAMNYPIVIGNDDLADKSYSVFGFPTSVLIARDGKQVKRFEGLTSYSELDQAIKSLL
jgi:thiol-disulfide isomerase/thioredoxin